jgi:dipeptidyl aminopeptidase/acylaminoacyl peptidase
MMRMRPCWLAIGLSLSLSSGAGAQPKVIVPGDNLVVQGVPKIPAALADTVRRYTEFRSAALADWHPRERALLILTRFGDTNQVHVVKTPGGARTQLTFFPERVGNASFQPATGEFFVSSKDMGGNERSQLYRYDLTGGAVSLLTDGKSRNSPPVWSRAGDRFAYSSTRRNGTDWDIYVMDPSKPGKDRLLVKANGMWHAVDWSADNSRLLALHYVSINESYLWLVDTLSGDKVPLTPPTSEKSSVGDGRLARDGKGVFLTTDKGSEFRRLVLLDMTPAGKETVLTGHIPWDVSDFELSADGQMLAFVSNEDGVGKLHLMNAQTGKELPAPTLPPGSVAHLQWHHTGRDLAFHLTSARSPADVYSLDISSGRVDRWTTSETGGLNTRGFVEPEQIHWQSFDGRDLSGYLYKPPARFTGKRPVIIDIHGGPESQFRPGFLARKNFYPSELGVALIFPNIRGSAGYGKSFLKLDNGFKRVAAYKDIAALLDWIKSRPDLDAERIMVTGGSYGGHMTLAVASRYADRIRCAVDVVGMSNLVTFLENTESYRRDLRRAEYGDERDPKMRAFMQSIAPLNNAHKITKPLFVIQGKNDPRVPWTEAEQIVATLKKQGTPVWYLTALDEGHGFVKKKNADFQFFATVQFVKEYLLK